MPNVQPKNGRFQARFRDAEGVQHSATFEAEVDAWAWAQRGEEAAFREEERSGFEAERGTLSLRRFAEEWLNTLEYDMSPQSLARMRRGFRAQIYPALGSTPLAELSPMQVKAWRNQPGYVNTTRRLATSWLLRCLEAAVDDGRMEDETLVRITRQLKKKASRGDYRLPVTALSIEKIEALAEALPEHLQIAVKIAAMSGLRISEVMGLTVDKVDFLRQEIYVHRQLKSLPKVGAYLGPTKTGSSYRTVPVETILIEEIAAHLARFPAREQPLPVSHDDRKFKPGFARLMVTNRRGGPYLAANFDHLIRKQAYGPLEGATFHQLRHHYASVQLAALMPLPELAAHLGHANPAVTLRVYSHFVPRPEGARRQAITEAWTGQQTPTVAQLRAISSDDSLNPMQNRE